MDGHFVQHGRMAAFITALNPQGEVPTGSPRQSPQPVNVAPAQCAQVLHGCEDGLHIDAVRWGWAPFGARGKQTDSLELPLETLGTQTDLRLLWPNARAVVPSDGWYQWVAQPQAPHSPDLYFMRLKNRRPMFFAALAQVHRGLAAQRGGGFVIITTAGEHQGRRPRVLEPELANEWLDPLLSPTRAEALVRHHCLPDSAFEWRKVNLALNNSSRQLRRSA
ncbi:SOS response-associated peptidase family protein [Pseudomonas sp. RA_35y_Pfl2_P32]|uniref:SOS response-associated peptidase family protein n=1 Tax=Pseudomonas sp. RA_35y_Pfl2_P32 TaxID=3088705 RepID=UPI0030DBC750